MFFVFFFLNSSKEAEEPKSSVFVTRFETTSDGIKTTNTKVSDIEGVLVEEVLSEPEQEKPNVHTDVVIEEVDELEGKRLNHRKMKGFFYIIKIIDELLTRIKTHIFNALVLEMAMH